MDRTESSSLNGKKIFVKKFGTKENGITLKSLDTLVKVWDPNIEIENILNKKDLLRIYPKKLKNWTKYPEAETDIWFFDEPRVGFNLIRRKV